MSFMTDLAAKLVANFAKKNHNHAGTYEPANANIQSHISNVNNPHVVTATQIGLENVTNDKQVKANASSVNNEIALWSGTTGDALKGGYTITSTLSDTATAIPTSSVVYTEINNLAVGLGGSLKPAVADKAALKAIDTSNATTHPDKTLILVESSGLYRLDRDSEATETGDFVIAPTTGAGRWIMMMNAAASHALLAGLQGGTTNEYYHMTASQYGAIPSGISSTNQLVAADNGKLTNLTTTGTLDIAYVTATTAEWNEFTTALG